MSFLVQASALTKVYRLGETVVRALRGVNLAIERGEMVAIMGPSGCGKSTLMHLLGLLDTATSGRILFEGEDVSLLSDSQRASFRGDKIGFVFQQFNLLKKFTSLENVLLPLLYSRKKSGSSDRGKEILLEVGLSGRINHPVSKLSGGEQQRVAIARSLINDPSLILADEPTGNLDSQSGSEILSLLRDLNRNGKTVIVVTHDPLVASVCQRMVKMKDGEIVG